MPENTNYKQEVSLFILAWQKKLTTLFKSRLVASVLMFYLPIKAAGFLLQITYDYKIFSMGIMISLLWLALAPMIIQIAWQQVNAFFQNNRELFKNKKEWRAIYENEIRRIQQLNYLPLRFLWSAAACLIIVFTSFFDAPNLIKLWCGISYFILFFCSTVGFYGVYVLINIFRKIFSAEIIFKPFHPDRFGGVSELSRFSVKISIYFSSGALVFPLIFEIIAELGEHNYLPGFFVYLLTGIFLITLFASFLFPIMQIKSYVDSKKEKIILESRRKLDKKIENFEQKENLNLKQGTEIFMYYYFTHQKLLQMKDYPWDVRTLLEFSLSFVIPIFIASLELFIL